MPKLNRFSKSGTDQLETVNDKNQKEHIVTAFKAIHGFVFTACVAMGMLQMCSLRFCREINASPIRWLRTRSNYFPSEATTADFVRKSFFRVFALEPDLTIMRYIHDVQLNYEDSNEDSLCA